MTWKNKYGHETSGYLVKPLRVKKGQRYPLLVVLYGFTGKFISQAEWISSYPVQVFAAHGFAVLMVNQPRAEEATAIKDYKWEQLVEAYGPMASIESAVDTLVANGLVDPTRKGIMGWSYGGFLTEFVVTHSDLFQAASAGECGLCDPGNYWAAGSRVFREAAERITGGPPYGPSLANWQEFSPSMNAHRVRAPVLLEHASKKVHPLEFYTAMKRQGKNVEMVIYPGEAHIFFQPRHRLASMARNLDWFSFWLKGEEDSDPAKTEQYTRWRKLRKLQEASLSKPD